MAIKKIKKIGIFYRPDNQKAEKWMKRIAAYIGKKYPRVQLVTRNYDVLLVLGGDGTILEAARSVQKSACLIVGLNLGTVGFLASSRSTQRFLETIDNLFAGRYRVVQRMLLDAKVKRKSKTVFATRALNEVVVLNPLGMVSIEADIDGLLFQTINGSGALVSTATGSTAYNLSAHGPIVTPNIKSFILTELWDHNIPTPSVVLGDNDEIKLKIKKFRKHEYLTIAKSNQKVDVMLVADGKEIFPLQQSDVVVLRRSKKTIPFAEFEKNYFLKSLRQKFAFK